MESESTTVSEDVEKMPKQKEKHINTLPNEMLRAILIKLDTNKLIGSRGVCSRWLLAVEFICREKKCLVIAAKCPPVNMTVRFNGLVHFEDKKCALVQVKEFNDSIRLPSQFAILLVRLFSHVENVAFDSHFETYSTETSRSLFTLLDCWAPTIVSLHLLPCGYFPFAYELPDRINKMANLKRIYIQTVDPLNETLARMEHFSAAISAMLRLAPNLGPKCTSLGLIYNPSLEDITQLFSLNNPLFTSVTHLNMFIGKPGVLSFVCGNFSALQVLNLKAFNIFLDEDTIGNLGRLSHLSHLSIDRIKIDLANLASTRSNNSKSPPTCLNSVRTLTLTEIVVVVSEVGQFDGAQFCRIVSSIFTNVEQLSIHSRDAWVRDGIATQHLEQFVHLRKHSIR